LFLKSSNIPPLSKSSNYKEGIDKIGVLLNPLFFNKADITKHKDPYRRLTLHRAGNFTVLSIHEEWFNPLFDYQFQIARAICHLINEGVINLKARWAKEDSMNDMWNLYLVYTIPQYFILSIVACEFFSDIKYGNISVDMNAG
jgi:hypothetical protein